MVRKIIILLFCWYCAQHVFSQTTDSTIFQLVQSDRLVTINQDKSIEEAVLNSIAQNAYKKNKGYRVRIFFDNGQKARQQSFAIARNFVITYQDIAVYHSYEDLYFRVAVGDFRTKSDAIRFQEFIKSTYPLAFIVPDIVNFQKIQQAREKISVEDDNIDANGD